MSRANHSGIFILFHQAVWPLGQQDCMRMAERQVDRPSENYIPYSYVNWDKQTCHGAPKTLLTPKSDDDVDPGVCALTTSVPEVIGLTITICLFCPFPVGVIIRTRVAPAVWDIGGNTGEAERPVLWGVYTTYLDCDWAAPTVGKRDVTGVVGVRRPDWLILWLDDCVLKTTCGRDCCQQTECRP